MISYFPTSYEDELLYSRCARYHAWNINASPETTMLDLLGDRRRTASIALPIHLGTLATRMGGNFNTVNKIINENTLLPLFRPFLWKDRVHKIETAMKTPVKRRQIYVTAGISGSNIKPLNFLQYCSECVKEDNKKYGEPYWHRAHQVPGVYICHKHGTWLQQSTVSIVNPANKQAFTALDKSVLRKECQVEKKECLDKYMLVARMVHWLLNNYPPILGPNQIRERYIFWLNKLSLTTKSGKVRLPQLRQQLELFYGKDLLSRIFSFEKGVDSFNWLIYLLRHPKVAMHPIRHILLICFFQLSSEDGFWNIEKEKEWKAPFGKGPWPCLNPACGYFKSPVIDQYSNEICYKAGHLKAKFSCSCGFHYTRMVSHNKRSNRYKVDGIVSLGPALEKELNRLRYLKKKTLMEIANLLNLTRYSIRKYFKQSTQVTDQNMKLEACNKQKDKETKRCRYRHTFSVFVKKHPNMTRSELRKNTPLFAWLAVNDRAWLFKNLPPKQNMTNFHRQFNWKELDEKLISKIPAAVNDIKQMTDKFVRVTSFEVIRRLGERQCIPAKLNKLPRTRKLLLQVTETWENFQIRRIKHAAVQLRKKGEIIKAYKLKEKTGMRSNSRYSDKVLEAFKKEISKL